MANYIECSRCGKEYKYDELNEHECADVITLRARLAALRESMKLDADTIAAKDARIAELTDLIDDYAIRYGLMWREIALLEKVAVDAITETRKWYAINMFAPPDEDIVKAIRRQYPGMVDRLIADMARRTCDLVLSNYRAALDAAKEGKDNAGTS